jgi:hypothetical protein
MQNGKEKRVRRQVHEVGELVVVYQLVLGFSLGEPFECRTLIKTNCRAEVHKKKFF